MSEWLRRRDFQNGLESVRASYNENRTRYERRIARADPAAEDDRRLLESHMRHWFLDRILRRLGWAHGLLIPEAPAEPAAPSELSRPSDFYHGRPAPTYRFAIAQMPLKPYQAARAAPWHRARAVGQDWETPLGPSILGDMSVLGTVKPVRSLVEPLQVAADNGARKVLIPTEHKRSFMEVSAEVLEPVDPIFYGDIRAAAVKALGVG